MKNPAHLWPPSPSPLGNVFKNPERSTIYEAWKSISFKQKNCQKYTKRLRKKN